MYRSARWRGSTRLADRAAAAGEAAAAPLRARLGELAAQAGALAALAALAERAAAHLARLAALLPPAPPRPALPKPQALGSGARSATGAAAGGGQRRLRRRGRGGARGRARSARRWRARSPSGGRSSRRRGGPRAPAPSGGAAEPSARLLLAPYASLAATVQAMRDKAERLRSSRFTIALFGAFSAGKSSLANALLGERGAAGVAESDDGGGQPDRAADGGAAARHRAVSMKSREAMLDDLRYSLGSAGRGCRETERLPRCWRRSASCRRTACMPADGRITAS